MKTALTIWGKRISPVFDSAHKLLIAEIENSKVINKQYKKFNPEKPSSLTNLLTKLYVEVLICGAISEVPANIIEVGGIKLIPFIAGYADEVLKSYARGKQNIPAFLMPGCGRKRHRHNRGNPENKLYGYFNARKGVMNVPRGNGTGPQGQGPGTGKGKGGCKSGRGGGGSVKTSGQGKGGGKGSGKGRSKGGR